MNIAKSHYKIIDRYFNDDISTAAHNLESLSVPEAIELLKRIAPKTTAKILFKLSPQFSAELLMEIDKERLQKILDKGGAELASHLLLFLTDEQKKYIIESMPLKLQNATQEILTFPKDSAGNWMKSDFTVFPPHISVSETIKTLRNKTRKQAPKSNIYITDDDGKLLGVVGMRDLILSQGSEKLENLMSKNVISVEPFTEIELVSRKLTEYKFLSIPVVTPQNNIIGVVRGNSILESAEAQATKDIQKLFGVGGEERAFSNIKFCLSKRLPWLHINLITAFLAASVVALFEDLISEVTILAVFLPVVAGQGGNAGAQSLAVVMRGIILREIPQQDTYRLVKKEAFVGAVNGIVVGTVTALIAWAWNGNPYIGVVIGLAMIVNLTAAGIAGAAIPLTMKRIGLDPAQSSSIILTTVTDIIGFFAFLGFALVFKSYLL